MSKRKVEDIITCGVLNFNVYCYQGYQTCHDVGKMISTLFAVTKEKSGTSCCRYSYTFHNHSVDFCNSFPYFTGSDVCEAFNQCVINEIFNLSTHRIMIITEDRRRAHICTEVEECTLINRNQLHNFLLVNNHDII
jgi:hypothetical protein